MKQFRIKTLMLAVLYACLAPASRADEQTKETHVSINGPLQVRDTLLAPGQYIFRLTEPQTDRTIVGIYNSQTGRLEATVIGLPAYRVKADGKDLFTVSPPQADQPAKLQTWFYPGDNVGIEFPQVKITTMTGNAAKTVEQAPDTGTTGDTLSIH